MDRGACSGTDADPRVLPQRNYCIDDARVFSAGVSMGGYFSNQVGCELSDRFRAVASIMGGGPLEYSVRCTKPMAAWIALEVRMPSTLPWS
jgi:poly(3-hydroxybutyrate) depolymerase